MPTFQGHLAPPDGRVAVVVARFNGPVTDSLLAGCLDTFARHGLPAERVDVVRVPGSFEIPLTARHLADSGRYAAVVCLGCIIRGETDHYDHVAAQTAAGIMQAGLTTGVPVVFGVLTTDTVEQALNRAGLKSGNKGVDAALTALEMINLLATLRGRASSDFGFSSRP
ncbi:MAG: 6,7-dimethyl-8-ribityllumazine synthase [Isosphaeraceae bacterium]|jgi:6,7-dimethyl-8-ribityllumazine synthase|nr:MAG: 6,7-dimethyl-8-ribityllumazine synthase [Isosphaeraceae bacterium]